MTMTNIVQDMKVMMQQDKGQAARLWLLFIAMVAGIGYLCYLGTNCVIEMMGGETAEQKVIRTYESAAGGQVDACVAPLPTVRSSAKATAIRRPAYRPAGAIRRPEVSSAMPPLVKPKWQQAANNSQAVKVFTTSSAKIHNLGSGMGTKGGNGGTTVVTSSATPFGSSTSSMLISSAVWTSSRSLSARNTLSAEQQMLASSDASQARPGNIRRDFPGDDPDPFPDPEAPIGDGVIALLLAALAYAAVIVFRRKRA